MPQLIIVYLPYNISLFSCPSVLKSRALWSQCCFSPQLQWCQDFTHIVHKSVHYGSKWHRHSEFKEKTVVFTTVKVCNKCFCKMYIMVYAVAESRIKHCCLFFINFSVCYFVCFLFNGSLNIFLKCEAIWKVAQIYSLTHHFSSVNDNNTKNVLCS